MSSLDTSPLAPAGSQPPKPASEQPLFSARGLHKSFGGVPVLRGMSLDVRDGEVHAVVGENGSGKSTTMNLIAGLLQADAGDMHLDGRPWQPRSARQAQAGGVAFIQQELNLFGELSLVDNLFLLRGPRTESRWPWKLRRQRHAQAEAWLAEVGLAHPPATPCHRLSAGERQLLEVAKALAAQARLLLFDEPTTSLSQPERERLFSLIGRLRKAGCGVLYVSHVLDDIFRLADRLTLLRDGLPVGSLWPHEMQAERVIEAISSRRRTVHSANSAHSGATPPAPEHTAPPDPAGLPGRSAPPTSPAAVSPQETTLPLLAVRHLTRHGAVEDASFELQPGEVLGLAGLMGAGRTELVRLVFGLDRWHAGEVQVRGQRLQNGHVADRLAAGMALLVEDRQHEGLLPEASVAANMALAALPRFCRGPLRWLDRRQRDREACGAAADVALQLPDVGAPLAPVRQLSGGNQQKALLGRWLLRRPRVWLLDEPTRGVDVNARADIHRWVRAQAAQGAGLLVVSSEQDELTAVCDRLLVMRHGRVVAEFQRQEFDADRILQAAMGLAGPVQAPATSTLAPHRP